MLTKHPNEGNVGTTASEPYPKYNNENVNNEPELSAL